MVLEYIDREGGCAPCLGSQLCLVDPPRLARRDADDADGGDDEQVEGGRADDGAGAELAGLELVLDDLDAGEQDLGRRGPERHQGEVGDGAVPDRNLDNLWGTELITFIIIWLS